MVTEVKWVAKIQRGEGTARVKDSLTAFLLSDSEQTIIFPCNHYRSCTWVDAFIFLISFDPLTVCEERAMSLGVSVSYQSCMARKWCSVVQLLESFPPDHITTVNPLDAPTWSYCWK